MRLKIGKRRRGGQEYTQSPQSGGAALPDCPGEESKSPERQGQGVALSDQLLERYERYLQELEKSDATVRKYLHDIREMSGCLGGLLREKTELLSYKDRLLSRGLQKQTVNVKISAVNSLLEYMGKKDWKLRRLRIQREIFQKDGKELTVKEYRMLVKAAEQKGDRRFALLMETLCGLGIRVSELSAVTVESLEQGKAEINMKGKVRTILFNKKLEEKLRAYSKEKNLSKGPVFVSRTGKPLDRSYIWRKMKDFAEASGVAKEKAFPHNLRHLFALTYYKQNKDIVRLADLLGHSSINTTRIYTIWKGNEQREQLERMELVS